MERNERHLAIRAAVAEKWTDNWRHVHEEDREAILSEVGIAVIVTEVLELGDEEWIKAALAYLEAKA